MKYLKLTTIEEYNALNDAISTSRGYPDELTATHQYAPEPEVTQVKDENDVVIEEYYKFPLTPDIMLIVELMAGKQIVEE